MSMHRLDEQTPIIDKEMGEKRNKHKKPSRPDSKVQIRYIKGKKKTTSQDQLIIFELRICDEMFFLFSNRTPIHARTVNNIRYK